MFLAIHVCAESVLSIVGGMLQPIFGGQATGKCLIKLGPVVSLMAAGSTGFCVYEEELRDLLTYDCPVTGRKRCPPYSDEWMGINKTRKTLRCTKQCLPNISFKTVRCHACIFLVETLDVSSVSRCASHQDEAVVHAPCLDHKNLFAHMGHLFYL